MFFAAGFFFGGGGLTGAAVIKWNQDAAEPLSEHDDKQARRIKKRESKLAAQEDLAGTAACSGWLHRWVSHWYGFGDWQLAEAEVRGNVLLLRDHTMPRVQTTTAVAFGHGTTCDAVPLAGATVDVRSDAPVEPASRGAVRQERTHTIVLQTSAGEQEKLRLPTADLHSRWVNVLRQTAAGLTSLRRRVIDVAFPSTWEQPHESFRLVPLEKGSSEYRRVAKLALSQQFKPSSGGQPYVKGKLAVKSVSRVQAPHVWEQYCLRRSIIASENEGSPGECMLWHGTPVPHLIVKDGFDPRVCALDGMFGAGVYFADRSTKSLRYAGASKPGDCGTLLLCRVSLGRPMLKWLPQANMRRPPDPMPLFGWEHFKMWREGSKFHSVFAQAGRTLLMNEYIVYHTNQAYPEYLIEFELK